MNFWISGAQEALKKTLQRVDLLVINDSEARELAEEPNLIRAAGMIRKMGPESLIIKKGEHGALLFTGDEIFSDRKSTRLNSSHVAISYAVFCLKKKTISR